MNKKDIIRMAREAGIEDWWDSGNEHREVLQEHLERFAALVASAERDACAKVADQMTQHSYLGKVGQAIRARGQA